MPDTPKAAETVGTRGWRNDPNVRAEIAEALCADGFYRFSGAELSRLLDASPVETAGTREPTPPDVTFLSHDITELRRLADGAEVRPEHRAVFKRALLHLSVHRAAPTPREADLLPEDREWLESQMVECQAVADASEGSHRRTHRELAARYRRILAARGSAPSRAQVEALPSYKRQVEEGFMKRGDAWLKRSDVLSLYSATPHETKEPSND